MLLLGILDSSFLFAPLGNDLLVVAMTAHPSPAMPGLLYYAGMSTIGSVLGCLLVDVILRHAAGEKGLERLSAAGSAYRLHQGEGGEERRVGAGGRFHLLLRRFLLRRSLWLRPRCNIRASGCWR